ncbi:DNA helicase Ino80, partial [Kipferlia bialata]|eukprot:g6486.t1
MTSHSIGLSIGTHTTVPVPISLAVTHHDDSDFGILSSVRDSVATYVDHFTVSLPASTHSPSDDAETDTEATETAGVEKASAEEGSLPRDSDDTAPQSPAQPVPSEATATVGGSDGEVSSPSPSPPSGPVPGWDLSTWVQGGIRGAETTQAQSDADSLPHCQGAGGMYMSPLSSVLFPLDSLDNIPLPSPSTSATQSRGEEGVGDEPLLDRERERERELEMQSSLYAEVFRLESAHSESAGLSSSCGGASPGSAVLASSDPGNDPHTQPGVKGERATQRETRYRYRSRQALVIPTPGDMAPIDTDPSVHREPQATLMWNPSPSRRRLYHKVAGASVPGREREREVARDATAEEGTPLSSLLSSINPETKGIGGVFADPVSAQGLQVVPPPSVDLAVWLGGHDSDAALSASPTASVCEYLQGVRDMEHVPMPGCEGWGLEGEGQGEGEEERGRAVCELVSEALDACLSIESTLSAPSPLSPLVSLGMLPSLLPVPTVSPPSDLATVLASLAGVQARDTLTSLRQMGCLDRVAPPSGQSVCGCVVGTVHSLLSLYHKGGSLSPQRVLQSLPTVMLVPPVDSVARDGTDAWTSIPLPLPVALSAIQSPTEVPATLRLYGSSLPGAGVVPAYLSLLGLCVTTVCADRHTLCTLGQSLIDTGSMHTHPDTHLALAGAAAQSPDASLSLSLQTDRDSQAKGRYAYDMVPGGGGALAQLRCKSVCAAARGMQDRDQARAGVLRRLGRDCSRHVRRRLRTGHKGAYVIGAEKVRARRIPRETVAWLRKSKTLHGEEDRRQQRHRDTRMRRADVEREEQRQKQKLSFLIKQTALYASFMKAGGEGEGEGEGEAPAAGVANPVFKGDNDSEVDAAAEARARAAAQKHRQHLNRFQTSSETTDADAEAPLGTVPPPASGPQTPAPAPAPQSQGAEAEAEVTQDQVIEVRVPQPTCFRGTLKSYQLTGLSWLVSLYKQGINGILSDEMGLGKTIQTISFLAYLYETENIPGPFLVIAPNSLLHNWATEISRFTPCLKVWPYWGTGPERKALRRGWELKGPLGRKNSAFHVLVCPYSIAVTDAKWLSKVLWNYIILDEAQAIKSASSSRWTQLTKYNARSRLLLSGTPVQNNMRELWALLNFIMPTLFDRHEEFNQWFSRGIENAVSAKASNLNARLNPEQLRRLQ